ncbi:MAG TPA: GrpB family protein [Solirubrobacterales bacterium]|jgi:GrpB-like predicted nucleotidyltransferase (UPF0157 family)
MQFRPESEIRELVAARFAAERSAILGLLPGSEVEHIGATAVPGSLTKADLDLLVRVPAGDFDRGVAALGERYEIHQPENWNDGFAGFVDPSSGEIPVGIQLVVAGGDDDQLFTEWRDRLIAEPDLLRRYNALKQAHRDARSEAYMAAKAEFIAASM